MDRKQYQVQVWGEDTGEFLSTFFGCNEYLKLNEWNVNEFNSDNMFDIDKFNEIAKYFNVSYLITDMANNIVKELIQD